MSTTTQNLNNASTQQEAPVVVSGKGSYTPGSATGTEQASGSSTALFQEGMSGLTANAMLDVMSALEEVADIYLQESIDQANMEKDLAKNVASFTIDSADDEASSLQAQGISGLISSGVSLGMVGYSSTGDSELNETSAELDGAKSYRSLMEREPESQVSDFDHPLSLDPDDWSDEEINRLPENQRATARRIQARSNAETDTQVKEGVAALKAKASLYNDESQFSTEQETGRASRALRGKEYTQRDPNETSSSDTQGQLTDKQVIELASPEELTDLKTSYDEKIKDLQAKRSEVKANLGERAQNLAAAGQALTSLGTSAGSTAASVYTQQKGLDDAGTAATQAALSTAQAVTSQSRSNADTYLGKSFDVASIMASISQSNANVN